MALGGAIITPPLVSLADLLPLFGGDLERRIILFGRYKGPADESGKDGRHREAAFVYSHDPTNGFVKARCTPGDP